MSVRNAALCAKVCACITLQRRQAWEPDAWPCVTIAQPCAKDCSVPRFQVNPGRFPYRVGKFLIPAKRWTDMQVNERAKRVSGSCPFSA